MNIPLSIALLVLMALLALVSYVDRLYAEMGKFLSREFQENIEAYEQHVEPRLKVTSERAALSMAMLTQLCVAGIGLVIGWLLFMDKPLGGARFGTGRRQPGIHHRHLQSPAALRIFCAHAGRMAGAFCAALRALIYLAMPATLVLGFALSVARLTREHAEEEPETSAEVVDALIEAGQEEGILEESDRDLIQSVVEFGDKTVHEVMTPRPEIVAVPITTTLQEFIELINKYPVLADSGL